MEYDIIIIGLAWASRVYGFAQTPGRKTVDNILIPGNISIASAWGKTGGGFSGVIIGGRLSVGS